MVIYLRGHEGRGIGLVAKLQAYQLQDGGRDTVDANLDLGLPADARHYGAATQILKDLGVCSVRLMTNNPDKVTNLEEYGITVAERVPLTPHPNDHNLAYLLTKRDRMGHVLPDLEATRLGGGRPVSGDGAARVEPFDASDSPGRRGRGELAHRGDGRSARRCRARAGRPPGRGRPWSGSPAPSSCRSPRRRSRGRGTTPSSRWASSIRGGTPHFDYVCSAATDGLTRVALDHGRRRLRRAHLRHRGAGPRPGRARGVERGQGPRGDLGRAGHRPHDPRDRTPREPGAQRVRQSGPDSASAA